MDSGQDYWPSVDNFMEAVRKKGNYDKDRIGRLVNISHHSFTLTILFSLVKDILLKDRVKYGIDDYQIEEGIPTALQYEMDNVVETGNNSSGDAGDATTVEDQNSTTSEGQGAQTTFTRQSTPAL